MVLDPIVPTKVLLSMDGCPITIIEEGDRVIDIFFGLFADIASL